MIPKCYYHCSDHCRQQNARNEDQEKLYYVGRIVFPPSFWVIPNPPFYQHRYGETPESRHNNRQCDSFLTKKTNDDAQHKTNDKILKAL